MTLFHFTGWARAIALVVAFAAQLPTPALAAAPVAAFFEASRQLETLAQAPQSGLPRLSDPAAAPYLIALTDAQGVLLDPRYEVADIGALMDICAQTNAVAVAYMLFGAKTSIDSTGDPVQVAQQLRRLANENAYRFQAELARLNAFNAHCFAVQIPLFDQLHASAQS